MSNNLPNGSLEKIRTQLELLKIRLDNLNKTLNFQEDILTILTENTRLLLKEVTVPSMYSNSTEEIMKKAFSKGRVPKILLK